MFPKPVNTYPHKNLIRPGALNGLNLVEVSQCSLCIFAFSRHICQTQSFQQNHHIIFPALVALNLLVSLISRVVACSARIVADKQTDRQTHRTITVTLAAHARRGLMITPRTRVGRERGLITPRTQVEWETEHHATDAGQRKCGEIDRQF